jgi:succinate dehydrogenase/fumarate reductase flavoprotein subunit
MVWKIKETLECDVVIVGAGLAGIRAAYDCLIAGKTVTMVTSQSICSGSSFSPFNSSLRAQLPLDESDIDNFVKSLVSSGKGIADESLYQIIAEEITGEIKRLEELRIPVTYHTGRAACFAEKSRLLAQIRDWKDIRQNVKAILNEFDNLKAVLIGDIERLIMENNRISGALVLDSNGNFIRINSKCVILATGGYCGLYEYSLNTTEICGIGHSVAMDAGCSLINMEFQQFIPGIISPKMNLLFGEIILQYCISVEDEDGNNLLSKYLPSDVSEKECLDLRSTHGPFTSAGISRYFDICMMDQSLNAGKMKGLTLRFDPAVMESTNFMVKDITDFYLLNKIDLATQPISISLFAHCANGGIMIDKNGETLVPGLLSAGECTGGIHGADRQGGVATATSIVFGARTAKRAISLCETISYNSTLKDDDVLNDFMKWSSNGDGNCPSAEEIQKKLGEKLWMNAGIIRSETITRPTLDWVVEMLEHFNTLKQLENGQNIRTILKAFHSLRVSKVMLKAILERKESRGGHFRLDYPELNNKKWNFRILLNDN